MFTNGVVEVSKISHLTAERLAWDFTWNALPHRHVEKYAEESKHSLVSMPLYLYRKHTKCRVFEWCAWGKTTQLVLIAASPYPVTIRAAGALVAFFWEGWHEWASADASWIKTQSHQKTTLFSQWGASTVAKRLRFCIIWGTEPSCPTLVLITALGVFWERGQRVLTWIRGGWDFPHWWPELEWEICAQDTKDSICLC